MAISTVSFLLGLNRPKRAGAAVTTMASSATDTGTSPTTVRATLGAGQNALRVWTGSTAASEKYFDVYVRRNSEPVIKVRMYRWQGRILQGNPGDTFAFATSDGRNLTLAAMTFPAALTLPSGATGTAACDRANPALWAPSAAHVTLPSTGSSFIIESDGTERWVYISERDPSSGNWSPARWVRLPATTDLVVVATYAEVALANEAGATLAITAPTGTVIGGSSAAMTLPMPTITGVTHTCTTGAQFATAIGAAVAGDEIVVSGAITLTGEVTRASFVANEAAGRKGYEGILIRGVTPGDRTSGVVSSGGFGWTIDQVSGVQPSGYAYMRDLTWDFGANAKKFSHDGGKYRIMNVRTTAGTGDTWDFEGTTTALTFDALYCRSDTSGDDCWNGNGSATYNASSRVRLVSCEGDTAGNAAASQCLTSHNGLPFEVYGGTWSNAHTNVIANDAITTPGYVFFATITEGARNAGVLNGIVLMGSDWDDGTTQTAIEAHFCRITATLATSTTTLFRNTAFVEHNILNVTVGRPVFNSVGGASISGNIFNGGNENFRLGNASGVQSSTAVRFNSFVGGNQGYAVIDASNMPSDFKNTASRSMTTSVNAPVGGGAISGNYNTLDPALDADYVVGSNDITGADAALDTTLWLPTEGGNCAGNGAPGMVDYIGDADPWGFVHIYSRSRCSRGAREIPAIYGGAVLYPEFFYG